MYEPSLVLQEPDTTVFGSPDTTEDDDILLLTLKSIDRIYIHIIYDFSTKFSP
jgi:hypothetical protein